MKDAKPDKRPRKDTLATRGHIVDAAEALFAEHGVDNVTLLDIARAAEVSVGTFYNYFETKGDLLLAIVVMEVEEVLASGTAIVANPPATVAKALCRLIGSILGC